MFWYTFRSLDTLVKKSKHSLFLLRVGLSTIQPWLAWISLPCWLQLYSNPPASDSVVVSMHTTLSSVPIPEEGMEIWGPQGRRVLRHLQFRMGSTGQPQEKDELQTLRHKEL